MQTVLVTLLFTTGLCQGLPSRAPIQQLKDYLYRYGYLPATDFEKGVLRTERELEQATMRLQKFMGLEVTGKLDGPTTELLGQPRCGRPDIVVMDEDRQGIVEVTDRPNNYTLSAYKLSPHRWTKNPVTYGFINRTPQFPATVVDDIIARAISRWTAASRLRLIKEPNLSKADIHIGFGARAHFGCPYPFDGPGGVLGHGFFPDGRPFSGDLHFDEDEKWSLGTSKDIDLLCVAVHEFGHSFGIDHSTIDRAIMFPTYRYHSNPQLHPDDVAAIRAHYGA